MATKVAPKAKAKAKASAQTETQATTTTETKASAKVTACIVAQINAQVNLTSKKRATCEAIRAEAKRLGIADDKKAVREMIKQSWIAAFPETASMNEAQLKYFVSKSQPDISKVYALAYPVNNRAEQQLKAAFDYNDSLSLDTPQASRLGEGRLLLIAGDKMSLKQALAQKEAKKRERQIDTVKTPYERAYNTLYAATASHVVGGKDRVTEADWKRAFNQALTDWLNKRTPEAKTTK